MVFSGPEFFRRADGGFNIAETASLESAASKAGPAQDAAN